MSMYQPVQANFFLSLQKPDGFDEPDGLVECAKQNEQWIKTVIYCHILCLRKEDEVAQVM